jgi:hypothetical protein
MTGSLRSVGELSDPVMGSRLVAARRQNPRHVILAMVGLSPPKVAIEVVIASLADKNDFQAVILGALELAPSGHGAIESNTTLHLRRTMISLPETPMEMPNAGTRSGRAGRE